MALISKVNLSKRIGIIAAFHCLLLLTSTACNAADIPLPKKVSELGRWQGFEIKGCGKRCCTLVIPIDYGYNNKEQLLALRELINSYGRLEHDLKCMMLYNYNALDHIVFLATTRQDIEAATMILNPKLYGGFDLDGELAEMYTTEYVLPVLEGYVNLSEILTDDLEESISSDICENMGFLLDDTRVLELIKILKFRKSEDFADKIHKIYKKCALENLGPLYGNGDE